MRVLAIAFAAWLALASSAAAKQETSTSGQVTATFSYAGGPGRGFSDLRLAIARAGQTVYDQPVKARRCAPDCSPGGLRRSIHARDLDADGEPEVVLDLYTGGAHCCFRTQIFTYSAPRYARAADHDWGNATARLKDVDRDGTAEFKSADGRFAYAFTSYAFSAFPVRILRWRDERLVDATQGFRHAVRNDARHWMRQYRHASIDPRGVLAAWAADRYRLGHRAAARRFLRRAVRPAFALRVDRKLRRWGY